MLLRLIPATTEIKFIRHRFLAIGTSLVLMIASLGLFFAEGLNYGIDFVGGTLVEIATPEAADLGAIRNVVEELGLGDVQVQEFGNSNDVLIRIEAQEGEGREGELAQRNAVRITQNALNELYSDITYTETADASGLTVRLSRTEGLDPEPTQAWLDSRVLSESNLSVIDASTLEITVAAPYRMTDGLTEEIAEEAQIIADLHETLDGAYSPVEFRRTEVVGPKVSGELVQAGTTAVIVSVLMVLLYIWFRFEWQFSLGAVAALVHDVVLTIGVFSLLRLEFNLSIIAALLTIVGYSLNDTVVVFDRVREKLRKYKRMALPDLLDFAINKTLSRTLMTSLTTLLALVALYSFGGEVIRGFTFAMIWGVLVGTYSSIFIASPVLLMLGVKRDWSGNTDNAAAAAARP